MRSTVFAVLMGASALALLTGTAAAQTSTSILENLDGTPAPLTDAPGGIPITTLYSSEGAAYTAATGTGANANKVLVDASGALVACGIHCNGVAPSGDHWVSASNQDPTLSYQWVPATYANVAAALPTPVAPVTVNPGSPTHFTNGWVSGDYAINAATGTPVNPSTCTTVGACTWVAPSAADPKIPASIAADVATLTPNPGGVTIQSASGNKTAVSTTGITIADKNGNSSSVTATGASWTSAAGSVVIADPSVTVSNANGSAIMQANGTTIGFVTADTHGNLTSMTPTGLTTTGTVAANAVTVGTGANKTTISGGNINTTGTVTASSVVATTGSFDTLSTTGYSDVGATLTSYGLRLNADDAAIKMLNNKADQAYSKATSAQNLAAIVAAFPELHFAPGDMFAVGVGGADAAGTGAWAAAAAMQVTPRFTVGIRGGQAGSNGVFAGTASYSFGGGGAFLK